jgi:signal transduction histidine kinase
LRVDAIRKRRMFHPVRYFSIASLISILLASVVLGVVYREVAEREMLSHGQAHNADMTRAFANSLWGELAPFVREARGLPGEALRGHERVARIDAAVVAQAKGLSILKIKLYDIDGRTIYSTERAQIGEDASRNGGVIGALQGRIVSELVFRHRFNALDRVVENADVLQSYVPITHPVTGSIEAVFELYGNVTPFLAEIRRTQRLVTGGVLLVAAALWAVLFLIVRRSDAIMRREAAGLARAEADSLDAKQAAQAAERAQSAFLAGIGRELRAPMNDIVAIADAGLADAALAPTGRAALERARDDARELLRAFDKIMVFADIEAGRLQITPAPLRLRALVERLVQTHGARARSRGLSLQAQVGEGTPDELMGDEARLELALANLLENAIEFTPKGAVTLTAEPAEPAAPGSEPATVEFQVRDTGVGIAPALQAGLFEPHAPGSSDDPARSAGSGLGLAISARLARLMNGALSYEPALGGGSLFRLRVRLDRVRP